MIPPSRMETHLKASFSSLKDRHYLGFAALSGGLDCFCGNILVGLHGDSTNGCGGPQADSDSLRFIDSSVECCLPMALVMSFSRLLSTKDGLLALRAEMVTSHSCRRSVTFNCYIRN